MAARAYDPLALQREAQTMRSERCEKGLLLYTATRWIGYLQGGVLWLNTHNTDLCKALWYESLRYWDSQYHAPYPTAFATEKPFVTQVVQHLRSQGWDCTREVRTPYGRIDILATRQEAVWVIEAKRSTDGPRLTMALGQLLGSQASYPQARLGIATPDPLPAHFQTLFARYHIHPVEGPWTSTTTD